MTKEEIRNALTDVKDRLKKLVPLAFGGEVPGAPEVNPAFEGKEYTTAEGMVLVIDKLEMGGIVTVEGNPMAPGMVNLADGTIITVGEGGAIVSVEVKTEEVMSEPDPRDAEIAQLKAQLATLQGANAQFSEQLTASQAQTGELAKQINTLTETMLQFAAEPSAEPIQAPGNKPPAGKTKTLAEIARENKSARNS